MHIIIIGSLLNLVIVADTNNIIILFPQTIVDNQVHTVWGGNLLPNPNACWDWVGWYGQNADQKGGELIGFVTILFHQLVVRTDRLWSIL
jgi:hypothetical protein